MIAKGNTHNNGAKLGRYMISAGKDNERADLYRLWGFAESDVVDAFRTIQAIAAGTNCEKPFFHCQVRTPNGEALTRSQWERVANRIESKLGLTDQPRAMAFHIKDGHEHLHIAWSRIDEQTMTAKALPFFKLRLKEVCRELEAELGLTPVRNEREKGEASAPTRDEYEQARRLGLDPKALRAEIREAWDRSDDGKSFAAALAERGFVLAKGERRDYVAVDREGGLHALGKRILGITAVHVRGKLADLDRDAMPSIAEARAQHRDRPSDKIYDRDAEERNWQGRVDAGGIKHDKDMRGAQKEVMSKMREAARADNATLREQKNKQFWKEYRERKDANTAKRTAEWERRAEADRKQSNPSTLSRGLVVADGLTGIVTKLVDFIEALLVGSTTPRQEPEPDPVDRIIEKRRAAAAINRLRQSMERGENLCASDVRSLTHDQLQNLRDRGDEGLRRMIEQVERDRQRARDDGRHRER